MQQILPQRIESLLHAIRELTPGQFNWLESTVQIFQCPHSYQIYKSDLLDEETLENFGDALRIHHSFSMEPFSKDKFEYVLEKVVNMNSHRASLASKGNPGHDITIDNIPISLKTQADKNIKEDKIWISKFMELGQGQWGDDPSHLNGLLKMFLKHLNKYERILILRALQKSPNWIYELVEVPKAILLLAETGTIEMKSNSKQFPKPGYCFVRKGDIDLYQLYFDGGGERKLQLKNLLKSLCIVHARWEFKVPEA